MSDAMASEINKRVGDRIRAFREMRGMVQSELSERTGIERSLLSRLERGEIETTLARYESVAKALRVPLHRLFGTGRRAA